MEFTIEFGGQPQDITVTFSGLADATTFQRYNDELTSDPRFGPGMLILADASALIPQLSSEAVQDTSETFSERDWAYPPRAIAIVAPDPKVFSSFRAARAHQGGSSSRRQVFSTREAALAWLTERRDSEPPR